ncbi:homer protein homolog 1 [Drosophila madeirensis]|uniref:Homer protein homolog 1 n=1 Tax=Drosophila madeirensis TaxID=30013 RepID=A0AAU9FDT6_DROMD
MATTTTTTITTTSSTTTTSKRYLSNFLMAEAESTLSNVTSIHTQLQSSLYETQNTAQLKALDKHSALLQELHQRQAAPRRRSSSSVAASEAAAAAAAAAEAAAAASGGGAKTATILVSKSKTKTGLPLLLKNSINN